jgi:ESAT-6 family protein
MAGLIFGVDLDELLATVDQLGRCGEALDALLADVAARVAALHGTWTGLAADAQAAAQAEWEAGFREMRDGLVAMRAAGMVAHDNYRCAADTNVRMWGQLS